MEEVVTVDSGSEFSYSEVSTSDLSDAAESSEESEWFEVDTSGPSAAGHSRFPFEADSTEFRSGY